MIPTKNVLMTIESTDENVPWIAGWLETILMKIWYPTTISSKSYYVKQMLSKYICTHEQRKSAEEKYKESWITEVDYFSKLTDDQKFQVSVMYHNFGDRGSTSVEAAAIGGFAHLTQFMGTDNFNSLFLCKKYYDASGAAGYSVWASEHSSVCSHGRNGEESFVIRMLQENPFLNIMSFVADSYDVYNFTNFCTKEDSKIRKMVESRKDFKFVLRPDSGNPLEVIREMLEIMQRNNVETIPHERILFKNYAILWGDGITPRQIKDILEYVTNLGYAAENFVFGSGGDLMQNINRDTQKFAVKCSSITIEAPIFGMTEEFISELVGYEKRNIDVFKDPITDPGKVSKKGKVTTYYNRATEKFEVGIVGEDSMYKVDILETVYENGEIVKTYSMDDVRNNINRTF